MTQAKGGTLAAFIKHPAIAPIVPLAGAAALFWFFNLAPKLATIETNVTNLNGRLGDIKSDSSGDMDKAEKRLTDLYEKSEIRITKQIDDVKNSVRDLTAKLDALSGKISSTGKSIDSIQTFVANVAGEQAKIPVSAWFLAIAPPNNPKTVGIHLIDGRTGLIKSWPSRAINDANPLAQIMASFWAVAMTSDGDAQNIRSVFYAADTVPLQRANVLTPCSFVMTVPASGISDDLVAHFLSLEKSKTVQGKGEPPTTFEKFMKFIQDNAVLLGN